MFKKLQKLFHKKILISLPLKSKLNLFSYTFAVYIKMGIGLHELSEDVLKGSECDGSTTDPIS